MSEFAVMITKVDGDNVTRKPGTSGEIFMLDATSGWQAKKEASEKYGNVLKAKRGDECMVVDNEDPCIVILINGEPYAACEERRIGNKMNGGEYQWYLMS